MQPCHVKARHVRIDERRLDFVKGQRRRIDDAGIGGTMREQLTGHDRAGIEADRTARDQVASAHRNEVRRTRPCADEMYHHGVSPVSASAQVAEPTAIRGAISLATGPPAARAAASATDGTPASATTRSDRVLTRAQAATRSPCDINASRTPIATAASAMPGSWHLAADVAIRQSSDAATPARANASMIAASISAARTPFRHPIPATIMV